MSTVAVIIPFYQAESGILASAVESVFQQSVDSDVHVDIIVIDDGSPISASAELAGVSLPARGFTLTVMKQPNGGPGSARNTGLKSLPDQTDFVAFLDSDDRWDRDHLQSALNTLAGDGDFYFSDHSRWYAKATWFQSSAVLQNWMAEENGRRIVNVGDPTVYEFLPNAAFISFIEDYLAQTSTVLYRFSRLGGVRFDTQLRRAGEDQMFWLELAKAARVVRFSITPRVHCGRGHNMYYGSLSWDHPEAARRLSYVLMLHAKIRRKFELEGAEKKAADEEFRRSEMTFVHVWLRKLLRTGAFDWQALRVAVAEDPWILPKALPIELAALWKRLYRYAIAPG